MYPDVTTSALVVESPTVDFLEDFPLLSSFYGLGYTYSKIETAQSSIDITFDLGTGKSRTVDHLIIGGTKSLVAASTNGVILSGSNNGTTWVNQLGTSSNFLTRTFDGPYSDSVIFTPNYNDEIAGTLAAYRYFKVTISKASGTAQFAFTKLYFGQAFDMGKEPDNYNLEVLTEDDADTWKYPRGHTIMSKAFYPKHQITVEWDGVTDAKANSFVNLLLSEPYKNTLYLYTETHKDPLYNNTLMQVRIVPESCSIEKRGDAEDWNDITAVFEEV